MNTPLPKNNKTANWTKHSGSRGFTLIEMIVVIAIFAIMAGLVLFNYTDFEANINLENTAQDIALEIQQAENNAVNGAYPTLRPGQSISSPNWRPSYGIYFSIANPNNYPKSLVFFLDQESVSPSDPNYNNVHLGINGRGYDTDASPFSCSGQECLDVLTLTNNASITGICHGDFTAPPTTCNDFNDVTLDFTRPFPDRFAIHGAVGPGNIDYTQVAGDVITDDVRIRVTSDVDKNARDIVVTPLGEIHIETVPAQ